MSDQNAVCDDLVGEKDAQPVCRTCGSSNVMRDAWAEWNPENGEWELGQVFDDGYCAKCEQSTKSFRWQKCGVDPVVEIRRLNDALRTGESGDGVIVVTSGVQAMGSVFLQAAMTAVQTFSDFNAHSDPHGEHDFGAFEIEGEKLFFKLDYYDLAMTAHSPDATGPAVTKRVLTIMLASEY